MQAKKPGGLSLGSGTEAREKDPLDNSSLWLI